MIITKYLHVLNNLHIIYVNSFVEYFIALIKFIFNFYIYHLTFSLIKSVHILFLSLVKA